MDRPTINSLIASLALLTLFATSGRAAQDEESAATLDTVLVTGEQTGPSLWKVSKDDHVLWILGTYTPLPKKMTWRSVEVENVMASSQAFLPSSVNVKADIGFFKGLTLLPSLIGVRDNPDDKKLKDVLPPELYDRWSVLKTKYIGRDKSVEDWRPIFAALELYTKALEKSGLEPRSQLEGAVAKLAKKSKLEDIEPTIKINIEKPRAAIKEFKKSSLDDVDCFAKTIERLETDLELMRTRANAWAHGDVETLRNMTHVNQVTACINAVMNSSLVQERGYDKLPEQISAMWMDAAESALSKYRSTLTMQPVGTLLDEQGILKQFRDKGYTVVEPK